MTDLIERDFHAPSSALDEAPRVYAPYSFEIGSRVRIRLSGACDFTPAPGSAAKQIRGRGHAPDADGLTGRVQFVASGGDWLAGQGHPYDVHYDGGYRTMADGTHGCCGSYAACELEPLPDVPAGDQARQEVGPLTGPAREGRCAVR